MSGMNQLSRKQMRLLERLGLMVAVVGLGAWASLIVMFFVGEPFGLINDVGNGALALLSGVLATASLASTHSPGRGLTMATSVAVAGAVVAVLGSALIIFDITGYFLAGLVSGTGFALIGVWLVVLSRSNEAVSALRLSARLVMFGTVAGAVMAVGLVNVAGIVMGVDDMDAAPGWLLIGGAGWTGTYLLLPIWGIWLSRSEKSS
jgi:hypothetical protein